MVEDLFGWTTSDIVTSSAYFQCLECNGEFIARSLIITRNKIGPSSGTDVLRKLQIQLIRKPCTYAKVDKLLYKNIMIYVVECLAKIQN